MSLYAWPPLLEFSGFHLLSRCVFSCSCFGVTICEGTVPCGHIFWLHAVFSVLPFTILMCIDEMRKQIMSSLSECIYMEEPHQQRHVHAHTLPLTGNAAPQSPPQPSGVEFLIRGVFLPCNECKSFKAALHRVCVNLCMCKYSMYIVCVNVCSP